MAAGKIPLEVSVLPLMAWALWEDAMGIWDAQSQVLRDLQLFPAYIGRGEGGVFICFLGGLGSVEPVATLGVWKMEPVLQKAQRCWVFPVSGWVFWSWSPGMGHQLVAQRVL